MASEYENDICRQSIGKYIKLLNNEGINIAKNKKKYYFADRNFDDSEIELLCHSVMANPSIPATYSSDLIRRLKALQSINFGNKRLDFNICNVDKRDNRELFLNIDIISKAIDENKTIRFHYLRYGDDKQMHDFKNREYYLAPLCIVCKQNRFYLLATSANCEFSGVRHYRIDKIQKIKIADECHMAKPNIDAYEYTKNRIYMQSGDIRTFKLLINDPYIFDELIDNCGMDIVVKKVRDNAYEVIVKAPESSIVFLACQYIQFIKVLSPLETKNKVINLLKNSLMNYTKLE